MSDVLSCDNGGLLVGTAHAIPDDPRAAYREGGALLGCNRLRCARCGAMVRHFDRVQLTRELLSGDEYAALWSAADPTSFALLRAAPVPTVRFYFCECFNFHTAGAVSAPSREDADWSCAGHPQ
jgi:hypothetical protein